MSRHNHSKCFFVEQSGFEGVWLGTPLGVVSYLCSLFGWNFEERYEHLLNQIEKIQKGSFLKHPDLALSIHRYNKDHE